jgi:CRP/FNR family transcriptional regulator, cyclic AMP receptor protein
MKTILLIDEDKMMRENTTEILELSNYRVLPVENVSRGLEVAVHIHPDIIICDEILPRTDGIKILKKIRMTKGVNEIPFILITAPDERPDERPDEIDGVYDGANEYLAKPFDGDELLRIVAKCLKETID